jgi:hypothetical protein
LAGRSAVMTGWSLPALDRLRRAAGRPRRQESSACGESMCPGGHRGRGHGGSPGHGAVADTGGHRQTAGRKGRGSHLPVASLSVVRRLVRGNRTMVLAPPGRLEVSKRPESGHSTTPAALPSTGEAPRNGEAVTGRLTAVDSRRRP